MEKKSKAPKIIIAVVVVFLAICCFIGIYDVWVMPNVDTEDLAMRISQNIYQYPASKKADVVNYEFYNDDTFICYNIKGKVVEKGEYRVYESLFSYKLELDGVKDDYTGTFELDDNNNVKSIEIDGKKIVDTERAHNRNKEE